MAILPRLKYNHIKRTCVVIFLCSVFCTIVLVVYLSLQNIDVNKTSLDLKSAGESAKSRGLGSNKMHRNVYGAIPTTNNPNIVDSKLPSLVYDAHIFYYPWYGNPTKNGKWLHWDHDYLPHWDKEEAKKWPRNRHVPPEDIGSSYYPSLGPYSSKDPEVIHDHMQQIKSTKIGVLSISWYPPKDAVGQGEEWDPWLLDLFNIASQYNLKVCFHIEPYKDRSPESLRKNLKYILNRYGSHPAFYRHEVNGNLLPVYYIYDSYLIKSSEWASLFKKDGQITVRGTELDGVFIGLLVEEKHKNEILEAGLDGFYTYFASDGFTFGSSSKNWMKLTSFATKHDLIFIPSIGPGYLDTRVRPWNHRNTKRRENGNYFERVFRAALNAKPKMLSITSFNEWHEGTQLEKSVPKEIPGFKYEDFLPHSPDFYLSLARKWVHKFHKHKNINTK